MGPTEIRTAPGAYLTDAIKNGYGPPLAYVRAQRAKERAEKKPDTWEEWDGEGEELRRREGRIGAARARLSPGELEAVELYFERYPAMRRTVRKRMEDPEQRRKVGGVIIRLLMERYGGPQAEG